MDIYVGNLSFQVTESELEKVFAKYGTITRVKIVTDRDTSRSKGFGFVTMDDDKGEEAIEALNGSTLQERPMTVNKAEKRENNNSNRPRSNFQSRNRF